jgi:hypothetical protein
MARPQSVFEMRRRTNKPPVALVSLSMMEPTITQNSALFIAHRSRAATRRSWFDFRRQVKSQREAPAVAGDQAGRTTQGSFLRFQQPHSA